MGGGTGTGPESLEEKAVEIEINKNLTKVVSAEGFVKSVSGFNEPIVSPIKITGYQKKLLITVEVLGSKEYIKGLIKFKGTSPVRDGDRIKVGLILDEYFETYGIGNILYLGILKKDGSFGRIDYMDGYNPIHNDAIKLGLP